MSLETARRGKLFSLHNFLSTKSYILDTGEQLSESFSKQSYDIKNRPDNSNLANLFHESHNINDNLNVTI